MVNISSFDLIKEQVPTKTIRELVSSIENDETLKMFITYIICECASGVKIPTKQHKIEVAKEALKSGIDAKKVKDKLNLSDKTIWRIK